MKKALTTAVIALTISSMSVTAQSKFNNEDRIALDYYRETVANPGKDIMPPSNLPFQLNPNSRGVTEACVLVKLAPGYTAADLESRGFTVLGEYPVNIAVEGSLEQIMALENFKGAEFVEFDRVATPLINVARKDTGMDKVYAGTNLPQAYSGKGVIAGIFDTGFDPNHINFKDSNGNLRIKQFYHYSRAGYYTAYTTPTSIANFTTDNKSGTHGTHTTGCMAGSFNGKTTELATASGVDKSGAVADLRGMAYGAEIFPAMGELYSTSYLNYLELLKIYSQDQKKPAVVNFSFGSNGGPLDGSQGSAKDIDAYAKDIPIFISSGNEGDTNNGIVHKFEKDGEMVKTFIVPGTGAETMTMSGNIQFYSNDATPFTLTFVVFDGGQKKELKKFDPITGPLSSSLVYATSDMAGASYIKDANFDRVYSNSKMTVTSSVDGRNNRYGLTANVSLKYSTSNSSRRYMLAVYVEGKAGQTISMANNAGYTVGGYIYRGEFYNRNLDGFTSGSPVLTINALSTGKNSIVVGSHNTTLSWPKIVGSNGSYNSGSVNDASTFSSYGVLNDGRTLPHFTAPGCAILSSYSHYLSGVRSSASADVEESDRHNYFAYTQGTSMSSPIAAGIAAVMLEANPSLTPADIRDILVSTATKDDYVKNGVAAKWGAGKINGYEAVKKALTYSGINDISTDYQSKPIVKATGNNIWEVTVPGVAGLTANLYSLSGQLAGSYSTAEDSLEIDASTLTGGVYVLSINGNSSIKIIVK